MRTEYQSIVVGLGGIGSGAAYWLARRLGEDVLGLEQFELGHDRGGSHDHSRIIRLSYHTPAYVELAKRAYAAWADLERDAGEQLILRTGGLDFGPRDGAIPLSNYADSMTACGVPFERLDAAEIRRRFPPFKVDDEIRGLFQAESGIAMADKANAAHQRMARRHGATLREHARVHRVESRDGEVVVETGDARYRAASLVIAADAWTNSILAHFGMRLPLEVTKEQLTYFRSPDAESFAPDRFPVWIWMDDPSFYGFPMFGPGVKVAQDAGGKPTDPNTRTFEPDADNLARVEAFLAKYLPSALGPIEYTKTCLYTLTPDRDFVIDVLPEHRNVALAIGAGHAFKFASVIGKTLAELALDRKTDAPIEDYRVDRHVLTLPDPPRHYMV
jgi:sarcosine oxidase